MASAFSHPAIPLAVALALGPGLVSGRLLAVGVVCSLLPDCDTLGFFVGVQYSHLFGHRGLSHSIAFAILMGAFAAAGSRQLRSRGAVAFAFVFIATVSHGVLDALTTGGLGVAFFSPWSNQRYFLPWRVISVSPIGLWAFFSPRGLLVLGSEFVWVWLPCSFIGLGGWCLRRWAMGPAAQKT